MNLRSQILHHGVVRLASAGLSFLLFSLLARRLEDNEAQRAMFFLFALGFGIATLRLVLHLTCGLDGHWTRSARLRRVVEGFRFSVWVTAVGAPLMGWIAWQHTSSGWLVGATMAVTALAMFDGDLLRGLRGQSPCFPSAFAAGTLLALGGLALTPSPNSNAACAWMLVQWAVVCVLNFKAAWRVFRIRSSINHTAGATHLPSLILLAVFDGAVLNAPFLGWLSIDASAALDLSLAMRVFVASLPLQPLLFHWANSDALTRASSRLHLNPLPGFVVILALSGVAIGLVFFIAFAWISGREVPHSVHLLFLALLLAYSSYAAVMRLEGPRIQPVSRLLAVGLPLALYLAALNWSPAEMLNSAIAIVAAQCAALSTAAAFMAVSSRSSTKTDFPNKNL